MAILKKYGYNVSWISETQCKKLSSIEEDSDRKVLFWEIIKENWIE